MKGRDSDFSRGLSQEEIEKVIRELTGQMSEILRRMLSGRPQTPHQDSSPYRVLGLDPSAPDEVVKLVYRRLAKHLHPDMPGGNAEAMVRINKAYEDIARQRKGSY